MKPKDEIKTSNALTEVWEWKEEVYQETKDMDFKQLKAYYQRCIEEASKKLGGR